jgi:hypothetical protein
LQAVAYPKLDSDYMVTHYFSLDTHIRATAKRNQAATARSHGDDERADDLEAAARPLMARWGKNLDSLPNLSEIPRQGRCIFVRKVCDQALSNDGSIPGLAAQALE